MQKLMLMLMQQQAVVKHRAMQTTQAVRATTRKTTHKKTRKRSTQHRRLQRMRSLRPASESQPRRYPGLSRLTTTAALSRCSTSVECRSSWTGPSSAAARTQKFSAGWSSTSKCSFERSRGICRASPRPSPLTSRQNCFRQTRCVCGRWRICAKGEPDDRPSMIACMVQSHVYVIGSEECERSIASSAVNPSKKAWESFLKGLIGENYSAICSYVQCNMCVRRSKRSHSTQFVVSEQTHTASDPLDCIRAQRAATGCLQRPYDGRGNGRGEQARQQRRGCAELRGRQHVASVHRRPSRSTPEQ